MVGAFVGGRAAAHLPAKALLLAFATMMVFTARSMLRGRGAGRAGSLSVGKALGLGGAVGFVAGMVGAGGGFLVVPALVLLGGLEMPRAVGTSLLVIAMQSLSGFAGHASRLALPWPFFGLLTAATMAGALGGLAVASRFDPATLRRVFGLLVLAMAAVFFGQELPSPAGWALGLGLAVAVALSSRAPQPSAATAA